MSGKVADHESEFAGKTRKRGLWAIFELIAILLAVATVSGFLGRWHWLFELTSHFRCQYMLMLAAIALLLFAIKLRKTALLASICCLINAAVVFPVFFSTQSDDQATKSFKVLFANVLVHNQDHDAIKALISELDPDVIVLFETDSDWLRDLEKLKEQYPYSIAEPHVGAFGIAMFSRLETTSLEVVWVGDSAVPAIRAKMKHRDRPLTLVGAHVFPPSSRIASRMRNSQMEDLATLVNDQESPCCLVGDLNVTPWSPYFKDLLRSANLRDSRKGFGIQPSWPTRNWLLSIPIDHCLVEDGIKVNSRRIGPAIGSDHYPIMVELDLAD